MVIDHIGLAVPRLEEGISLWKELFGYRQLTEPIVNTRQKVRVVFLVKEASPTVKLLEPLGPSSPAFRLAQKGGGFHHLCFRCSDLGATVDKMESIGLRVLSDPEPGEAFGNERIAFVYVGQGLNIELIDTENKAGILETAGKDQPSK